MLHAVLPAHLLHQQVRIGLDVQRLDAVVRRPAERRQQAAVLGDVVRGDAERFLQLDDRAVVALDADAVAGGPGLPRDAAVDIRDRGPPPAPKSDAGSSARHELGTTLSDVEGHEVWVTAGSAGAGGGT